jgi:hypothetical protein
MRMAATAATITRMAATATTISMLRAVRRPPPVGDVKAVARIGKGSPELVHDQDAVSRIAR